MRLVQAGALIMEQVLTFGKREVLLTSEKPPYIFKLLDFGGFFDDVFHFVLQLQRMVSQLLAVYELLQAVWIRHQLLPFF